MTQKRPGYRTDQAFTVDDLTANEYGALARLIKGDPTAAFTNPGSILGGDAVAGLAMLRDRRSQPSATLGTYQARTMSELQRDLGLLPDPALLHEVTPLEEYSDDDAQAERIRSVVEQADEDAEAVAGEGVDPSAPPASPASP